MIRYGIGKGSLSEKMPAPSQLDATIVNFKPTLSEASFLQDGSKIIRYGMG